MNYNEFNVDDGRISLISRRKNCQRLFAMMSVIIFFQTIFLAMMITISVSIYDKYQNIEPAVNKFAKLMLEINVTKITNILKDLDLDQIKYLLTSVGNVDALLTSVGNVDALLTSVNNIDTLLTSVNNVETLLIGFKQCIRASHLCSLD